VSYYLKIKYITQKITTIKIPKTVNHFAASVCINLLNVSPNLKDRYETMKNLKPLDIKQMKTNMNKLKPIIPLVIVNTLNGRGVKPARNKVASQI
tara:strand:- start:3 stop:287 length:285 start_codon:yes stop_codon:yes gene_type:complete